MTKRAFDEWYSNWKVGDWIVWEEDKEGEKMQITEMDFIYERVFWQEDGEQCMTRATNLLRVRDDA